MEIQTLSVLAGSSACNARCPFCISKMTPAQGVKLKEPEVNWRNFRKACTFARQKGVSTVMITGKGEPTLFPDQITKYLSAMKEFDFPIIELQTNGILLATAKEEYSKYWHKLNDWYWLGMTTIAISVVHYDSEKNREIYAPYKKKYMDLPGLIDSLHEKKYSVRLACIMADGGLEKIIAFSRENKVEQLTVRSVNKPEHSGDAVAEKWVEEHYLTERQREDISSYLEDRGHKLMELSHGATVYDVDGQNVCLANSLTLNPKSDCLRQLIFFPDGHLSYDWQYGGAILL